MMPRAIASRLVAMMLIGPGIAAAQPPTPSASDAPPILTLFTTPDDVALAIRGPIEIHGRTPIDFPPFVTGRYSLMGQKDGAARTQGVLHVLPPRGEKAVLLSEPPGLSPGLIVRSLNYPGIPGILSKREHRGLLLALAGTGGLLASGSAHLAYRDRLRESGPEAGERALDEVQSRFDWAVYAWSVWGASALDYVLRARFQVQEATSSRVLLSLPDVRRGSILWRSLLVPGAGQEFANHRGRGAVWLGAVLAAGAGVTMADDWVRRDETRVGLAEGRLGSAQPAERDARLRELAVARDDLGWSRDVRRGWKNVLIGAYVANLLDAMVIPAGPPTAAAPRVSTSFPVTPSGPVVALTLRY